MAAAAGTALGAICAAYGYGGLSELVAANADYVVDGVCRQLRHLDTHSRWALLALLNRWLVRKKDWLIAEIRP